MDPGSPFEADVVQVHEFAAGHPTQVTKAAVAGAEQGSQSLALQAAPRQIAVGSLPVVSEKTAAGRKGAVPA